MEASGSGQGHATQLFNMQFGAIGAVTAAGCLVVLDLLALSDSENMQQAMRRLYLWIAASAAALTTIDLLRLHKHAGAYKAVLNTAYVHNVHVHRNVHVYWLLHYDQHALS